MGFILSRYSSDMLIFIKNISKTISTSFLLFFIDALKCDANYLFQDEMQNLKIEDRATPSEMENLVKKYRSLDKYGKDTVCMILEREHKRCMDYTVLSQDDENFLIIEQTK